MPQQNPADANFKPTIVYLILSRQTEQALELLAKAYGLEIPKLKVGLPKGHVRNAYGTYSAQNQTICVLDSDTLWNPFVILHEFYHHLRTKGVDKMHRGTEKNADKFALEFIREYEATAAKAAAEKSN
jgi:hypothetical protein